MKHKPYILLLSILCLFALFACEKKTAPQSQSQLAIDKALIQVHFSPGGSPTAALVKVLDEAKDSVLVQAYSFTSAPIAAALKRAHDRGINVKVVLDKSQRSEKYTSATFLHHAGIPVWIDRKHAIAHNKVMIIDETIVITGSFNFSRAAEERNAENLLIIMNRQLAGEYIANWEIHREHSEVY